VSGRGYRYAWTKRYGVSPQVVGEIVERFPSNTAVNLVKEASRRASPLHKLFEWNNSRAAQQYRLIQARVMIASLRVEVVDVGGKVRNITAFVGSADRAGGFSPILEADDDELDAAEAQCFRQMLAFKSRWKGLQFARLVTSAIDATSATATRRKRKKPRAGKRA
jgi:hypothetical protein